jgi:hypothetical protein
LYVSRALTFSISKFIHCPLSQQRNPDRESLSLTGAPSSITGLEQPGDLDLL